MNVTFPSLHSVISMILGDDALIILKGRWKGLTGLLILFTVTAVLDYFIITIMDKIIVLFGDFANGNFFDQPTWNYLILILIIFRPLISWLIVGYSVYIANLILRGIENDVTRIFTETKFIKNANIDAEEVTNTFITYGRWFIDALMLPFIRALFETFILIALSVGILRQFPLEVCIFAGTLATLLLLYQKITRKLIQSHGRNVIKTSENLMKITRNLLSSDNPGFTNLKFKDSLRSELDVKFISSSITGAFAQGIKNVIELAAIFALGIAAIASIVFSEADLVLFVSTFFYLIIRLLPSVSAILVFFQSKNSANFAVTRLALVIKADMT